MDWYEIILKRDVWPFEKFENDEVVETFGADIKTGIERVTKKCNLKIIPCNDVLYEDEMSRYRMTSQLEGKHHVKGVNTFVHNGCGYFLYDDYEGNLMTYNPAKINLN